MNKPITEEEVAKTIEFNKKILPILKSGFEYGDGFDEHYVEDFVDKLNNSFPIVFKTHHRKTNL